MIYNIVTEPELAQLFYDTIEQRPNLEPADYSSLREYKREQNRLASQLRKARKALSEFITKPLDRKALQNAFELNDELILTDEPDGKLKLVSNITEYRQAVYNVLDWYNSLTTR